MKTKRQVLYIVINFSLGSMKSQSDVLIENIANGGKILSAVADSNGFVHYIISLEKEL